MNGSLPAGAIDLHVHCAPDVRPRKMTGVELVRAAAAAGMRGVLLKNHEWSTAAMAGTLREVFPSFAVHGGIVLNEAVGGLNPRAVEMALRAGGKEVWMPTHCGEGERAWRGRAGTGIGALDPAGRVRGELQDILKLIAEHNAIFGTGHMSADEIRMVVPAARAAGVRKVLVTHPEIRFVNLSAAAQRELAAPGVWFERCYVRDGFLLDWDGFARAIREAGVEYTVLATDLGQPDNPDPVAGFAEMAAQLSARGFSPGELRTMMADTPARLLDLA